MQHAQVSCGIQDGTRLVAAKRYTSTLIGKGDFDGIISKVGECTDQNIVQFYGCAVVKVSSIKILVPFGMPALVANCLHALPLHYVYTPDK